MTDMTDLSSAGVSVWERDLHAHLTSHANAERGLLDGYSAAAEESPSRALRYLVNLLIEDEKRHHRMFMEIADSLKAEALLSGKDPIVPYIDFNRATNHDAVIALTTQLLQKEQQDALELRRLQREMRTVKDTSLWSLLVDLMERDTKKHIAILRFVKKHTGRRKR